MTLDLPSLRARLARRRELDVVDSRILALVDLDALVQAMPQLLDIVEAAIATVNDDGDRTTMQRLFAAVDAARRGTP